MELRGVGQKELAELLNSRSRASEILNRKRPLSLDQIRKIAAAWDVPAEAMISEYELTA
jgi:HTH-type transcriptional regulator/antitoxin HigA